MRSHLFEPGRRTCGKVGPFELVMSSLRVAPLGHSVPRLIGWSGSPSTCTTCAVTFFALSPRVWMITPHDTAQYGQVLRVSVVRAILNCRISARALDMSKPMPTAAPPSAAPCRNVRRFIGGLQAVCEANTHALPPMLSSPWSDRLMCDGPFRSRYSHVRSVHVPRRRAGGRGTRPEAPSGKVRDRGRCQLGARALRRRFSASGGRDARRAGRPLGALGARPARHRAQLRGRGAGGAPLPGDRLHLQRSAARLRARNALAARARAVRRVRGEARGGPRDRRGGARRAAVRDPPVHRDAGRAARRPDGPRGGHRTLEFIPPAVRRKLDLAGLKLSLKAWTAMARSERLAICHLPVDGPGDLEVYREALAAFAERAGHPVAPLEGGPLDGSAWGAARIPESVAARAPKLLLAQWSALPEEARYVLFRLAEPRRAPDKLNAALRELRLTQPPP